MIKYNNTNNASTTLTAWISASSTTLIVENGAILPTAPFLLTLEHFDNEKVTVREIVKCIAKADNILTIQRGAWTCVQDDSASTKEQGNSAHSFSVGDCASIYWTSEQVQDIQNEIEKKLNVSDFQAWTYVYSSTSTWTDAYSITIPWTLTSYAVGQVFRFMADVDNEWNATLNINGLWAVEIRKNHDKILDNGDIEAGQIVEVAYDWTYFQMDSQVATVVDLWNINSLKETGVVGEKYALTNALFLQSCPISSTSFWEYNIWDIEANTQVHIQRIWSWLESETITLKIKKVWAPTTSLHCDVFSGTLYDVSPTESAWYWTWTAIATSNKSYLDFSADWTVVTFVLDTPIWWTKGQLLDIVIYQDWNIVNNSNYYVLACDSTQYSESFRCLWVNWNTITPNKISPYCDSIWFLSCLYVKMWAEEQIWTSNYSKNENVVAPNSHYPAWWLDYFSIVAPYSWRYLIKINATNDNEGGTATKWTIAVFINGTEVDKNDYTSDSTFSQDFQIDANYWDVITVRIYSERNNNYYWDTLTANRCTITSTITLWKRYDYFSHPINVVDLWDIATCTLYWKHIDKTYYGGIMVEKTTSATGGTIVLGNAVGYIKVNFNWEILKIPFYY